MKINETRKRSLAKATTHKLFEIAFDMLVLWAGYEILKPLSVTDIFILSVVVEVACFYGGYINERIWNKFNYGREIK